MKGPHYSQYIDFFPDLYIATSLDGTKNKKKAPDQPFTEYPKLWQTSAQAKKTLVATPYELLYRMRKKLEIEDNKTQHHQISFSSCHI